MQPLEAGDPQDLGGFRLLGRLGAGGMGQVYLGRTSGGRTVAVKAVRPDLARDAQFRERFRQEVAAARRVGGDWTAPVLDADTEGPQPWVASGFVAGPSLAEAVHEHGPLPEPTVRLLGVGLAEALAHVHALGLVHRDVKPSNVLLTLDGPRLIDFGIARALDATSGLTQTGHVVGSPGYMSPEQAQGRPAGPASDVFSLGAVLALAATGRQPFGDGVSGAVLLYRVLHEQPDLAEVEPRLRELLLACLAKQPDDRPTPQQLRARLDPEHTAAGRLGRSSWLSADLAAAVGRTAVRLLDLESAPPIPAPAPPIPAPAPPIPAPPGHAPPTLSGPVHPHPVHPYPAHPAAPTGYGPPPPEPRRGRGRRIVLLIAAVLAVAALGGYGLAKLGDGGGNGGGTSADGANRTPAASAPATDEPSGSPSGTSSAKPSDKPSDKPSAKSPAGTADTDVPQAFVGVWEAKGADDSNLRIQVGKSRIGDQFAAGALLNGGPGGYCSASWTLLSVSDGELRFTSRPVGSADRQCATSGERVLDLQKDGTLRYTAVIDGERAEPVPMHRTT
ncbi:serine/threonine protein kinase [Kitasatospora sp. NA04385]|uniref:serine/threonine-protein kinase n=1 Tax=Kitasatospora sp. NA04385 TaxID=2742135 RepID=UPI0015928A4F|nr:serine/threonine-protein kinase [Kitasatospora sp. NA04385]QKW20964.1 serine/threonine protein kinase [Kitasatospora sp. NA04385]